MRAPPPAVEGNLDMKPLYVHRPGGRRARAIDDATESFVNDTRMGQAAE